MTFGGAGAPHSGVVIMSNVLIGIIGVILFIGLALAGALFLGPRFQDATANSKASAAVQAVAQVASAIELYEVQEGRRFTSGPTDDLVSRGYLKTAVANPLVPTWNVDTRNLGGTTNDGSVAGVAAIGFYESPTNARICAAIARQSGQTLGANDAPPVGGATLPSTVQGCFLNKGPWGDVPTDLYVVYRKVR